MAVLTIPDDVPDHKIEDTFRPTADQYHPSQPQINDADIDKALAMITKDERPIAFFGVGAKGARTEAKEFVEKHSIPFPDHAGQVNHLPQPSQCPEPVVRAGYQAGP